MSLGDEQAEFDEQNVLLAKTLVDFLNEEELKKGVSELPKGAMGITKLAAFLKANSISDTEQHLKFLRGLQRLRSKSVHRKTEEYEDALDKLCVKAFHRVDASYRVFQMAVDFLQWLGSKIAVAESA